MKQSEVDTIMEELKRSKHSGMSFKTSDTLIHLWASEIRKILNKQKTKERK